MTTAFTFLLIVAASGAALLILISDNWHGIIAGLGIQYLIAFLMVTQVWPVGLAAIKLVAGWLACVLLSLTASPDLIFDNIYAVRAARIFRFTSTFIIFILIFAAAPIMNSWLPIPYDHLLIGLMMIGFGILQLGFSRIHFRIFSGILTLLTGFEIIYAPLEGSALLAAILAGITLAIGLIGSAVFRRDRVQGNQ